MSEVRMLKVSLKRSPIGRPARQRQTLHALGLTRLGQSVIVPDNGPTRGRIGAVAHLVAVEG
ncbi:MAG: 50S ribosomal protein L30 [Candidatus Binatia bacterium]